MLKYKKNYSVLGCCHNKNKGSMSYIRAGRHKANMILVSKGISPLIASKRTYMRRNRFNLYMKLRIEILKAIRRSNIVISFSCNVLVLYEFNLIRF